MTVVAAASATVSRIAVQISGDSAAKPGYCSPPTS
jgi:hypothetical protein